MYDPEHDELIARIAKQNPGLANDLEWRDAIFALAYTKPPDCRPLAAMLRSEKPISWAIRQTLAEMLDPGKPDLEPITLITLKPVRRRGVTMRKLQLSFESMNAVIKYERLRRAGKSAVDARALVAKRYHWNIEESVFNRRRKRVLAYLASLPSGYGEALITGKNFSK